MNKEIEDKDKDEDEDKGLKQILIKLPPDCLKFIREFLITGEMLIQSIQLKYKYIPTSLLSYSFGIEHCSSNFAGSGYEKLIKLMEIFTLQEIHKHFPVTTGRYNELKQETVMNYIRQHIISPWIEADYMKPNWYACVSKIVICARYKDKAIKLKKFLLERDPDLIRFMRTFLLTDEMQRERIRTKYLTSNCDTNTKVLLFSLDEIQKNDLFPIILDDVVPSNIICYKNFTDTTRQHLLVTQKSTFLTCIKSFLSFDKEEIDNWKSNEDYISDLSLIKATSIEHLGTNFDGTGFKLLLEAMDIFTLEEIQEHFPSNGIFNDNKLWAMINYIMNDIMIPFLSKAPYLSTDNIMCAKVYENIRKIIVCSETKRKAI